jgi:hypothetical protein
MPSGTGFPDLGHYVGGVSNAVSFSNKSSAKFDRKSLACSELGLSEAWAIGRGVLQSGAR